VSPAYVCTLQIEQTVVRSLFRRMHVRNGSLARAPHEPPDSGTRRTHSTPSRKVHRCQVLLGLARRRTVSFPTACVGRGDHALGRVDAFGCSANASIVFFLEIWQFFVLSETPGSTRYPSRAATGGHGATTGLRTYLIGWVGDHQCDSRHGQPGHPRRSSGRGDRHHRQPRPRWRGRTAHPTTVCDALSRYDRRLLVRTVCYQSCIAFLFTVVIYSVGDGTARL